MDRRALHVVCGLACGVAGSPATAAESSSAFKEEVSAGLEEISIFCTGRTVRTFNCNLAISGLPQGYAAGWLSSSTAAPILGANAPPDAHVRGYLSTSIVTLRLWKLAVP